MGGHHQLPLLEGLGWQLLVEVLAALDAVDDAGSRRRRSPTTELEGSRGTALVTWDPVLANSHEPCATGLS